MKASIFEIGATGVDAAKIVDTIRETVAVKMRQGVYTDAHVAKAEKTNLENLRDEEEFHAFYLECLRDAVSVDISDFDILERRLRFSSLFVALKKTIWKLLKFYTYRLWSQQNLVNGLLLSAVEGTENKSRDRIQTLEARIAKLEAAAGKDGAATCQTRGP